jgi:phage terminase large subunit GpA-like protein
LRVSFRRALPIVAGALAAILAPPEPLVPSHWMRDNLIVPDGPRAGSKWDPDLTPYVGPIVDALGPDAPHNIAIVRKSVQTGISVAGIGLLAAYIALAPARMAIALPTLDKLQEFNSEKLQPTIEQTPALNKKIRRQTSRLATGSTSVRKKFPGGSLLLLNANSAKDLKSSTLKIGVGDEVDEWADDLDEQGDPWDQYKGRFTAFHATGDWRLLGLSTPTLVNASKIDALFKAGDQRFWHVKCPQCGEEIALEFGHLRYEPRPPHRAEYVAQCCGYPIPQFMKARLVRAGRFVPRNPEGAYPSFHVDALISQLTTWDHLVEAFLAAGSDEKKLKAFYNLWLGLPYELRGDAPDHELLARRVERELKRGQVPARGLVLTAFADVQQRGVWLEVVAHASNRETWSVDALYISGDTSDPNGDVFRQLRRETIDREFPDAFGRMRRLDAFAIDSGFRAHVVYAFVRNAQRAHPDTGKDLILATKGLTGWSRPAIGQPTLVDIDLAGKKVKQGAKVWGLGTWPLKVTTYSDLKLELPADVLQADGYCHFGAWNDEVYFRQLTAEQLEETKFRGHTTGRKWVKRGENHFLDCRVGNLALAEYLGLSSTTPEQWAALAAARGLPAELTSVDLFTPRGIAPTLAPAAAEAAIEKQKELEREAEGGALRRPGPWIGRRRNWLKH